MEKTYYIKINGEILDQFPTLEDAKQELRHWDSYAEVWEADVKENSKVKDKLVHKHN